MKKRFEEAIESLFSLDMRGLALARISFGLLILADLFNRARSLTAHYTDTGVLPRALMDASGVVEPLDISLHLLSGSATWQMCLFLVAAVFALMLVFGYRTRLASIASWVLLVSLQNANPLVLQGGDIAFRIALFWGIFVPWGSVLSLDARRGVTRVSADNTTHVSVGTVAWILNVAMIYVGAATLKDHMYWFGVHASAVQMALHIDQFVTYIGLFARTFFAPVFLSMVTSLVFLTQVIAPITFFIPSKKALVRGIGAGVLILMHMSFIPFLRLGLFPFIDITFLLPLLPTRFFDYVFTKIPRNLQQYVRMPSGGAYTRQLFMLEIVAIIFLFFSVVVNIRAHSAVSIRLPESMETVVALTRFDQYWSLFAPYPLTDDGWYIVPGTLASGRRVDLFDGGTDISFEKPARVSQDYPTQRWRKYMMNIWMRKYASVRSGYMAWHCREWNKTHEGDERLTTVELIFMLERTDLADTDPSAEKVLLGTWNCDTQQ